MLTLSTIPKARLHETVILVDASEIGNHVHLQYTTSIEKDWLLLAKVESGSYAGLCSINLKHLLYGNVTIRKHVSRLLVRDSSKVDRIVGLQDLRSFVGKFRKERFNGF